MVNVKDSGRYFNGKLYKYYDSRHTKLSAKELSIKLRNKGYYVRIIYILNKTYMVENYEIWIRQKGYK